MRERISFFSRERKTWGGRALRLTALTVITLLLLINLIGWGVYFYTRSFLNEEMGQRLVAIARTSRMTLPNLVLLSYIEVFYPRYIVSMPAGEGPTSQNAARDSREAATLLKILKDIRDQNNLEEVFLVNEKRELLLSTSDNTPLGEEVRMLLLDRSEIMEAISGRAAASTLYSVEGRYFRRAYAPLYLGGEARGVIGVSASVEFFDHLEDFRRILYLIMGLSVALGVVVSVVHYRMAQAMLTTQRELERSSRLAELGHMAACVAHEIRNPLSIISGTVQVLERRRAAESRTDEQELYDYLHDEVDRLNRVVTNFLDFARPAGMNRTMTDINALVERSSEGVDRELEERSIGLRLDLDPKMGEFFVDAERIQQVLLNLLLNAGEAMKQDGRAGTVTLKTERRGRSGVISVTDEGLGISMEDVGRVFDPFFSTKPGGSGLGLSIVKSLVEAHDGEIKVDSRPGIGTTFTIILPQGAGS